MNASGRLNSPALSESLKKGSEREREKKGPKLAIIELVLFVGERAFKEHYWKKRAQIRRQCRGATELREEPGPAP